MVTWWKPESSSILCQPARGSPPAIQPVHRSTSHPAWRARSVGIYRLWRDGGFAVGALLAGVLADLTSIPAAIYAVAALTAASGLFVAVRMYETHPR